MKKALYSSSLFSRPLMRILFGFLSVCFWLLVWWLIALKIDKPLLLPTPWAVLARLGQLILSKGFWRIAVLSIGRILYGILLSVLIGIPFAVLTARFDTLRLLFRPLLTVIRSTPVAAFIVLLWLMIGRDDVPTVITVLIALPVIFSSLETGIRGMDKSLLETAKVFRVPLPKRILFLDIPSLLPAFESALQTAVGLGWKAGIAAEILVRPAEAIGRKISDANYNLESVDLFAWTLTVILLSLFIELLFSTLLSRLFRFAAPKQTDSKPAEESQATNETERNV